VCPQGPILGPPPLRHRSVEAATHEEDTLAGVRIAYGVHGYGRGHATRVLALLPELAKRHEVRVFAGGDAFELLARRFPAERIPFLSFDYRDFRLSLASTIAANAGMAWDLFARGPFSRRLEERLLDLGPEVVVSDSEPLLLRAARRLGIPTVGLDHVGVIAHCRPRVPLRDRLQLAAQAAVYRLVVGPVERAVVSSFYEAPPRRPGVRCVSPILRESVLGATPFRGAHLLVYFNNGDRLYAPHVESALRALDCPVRVYGAGREGQDGNVFYAPIDEDRFVADLAGCRAVFATGGHQLISEALHLGKPILVSPERSAEQRLNAFQVEALGVGVSVRHSQISAAVVDEFLRRGDGYRAALARLERRRAPPPLEVLEPVLRELAAERLSGVGSTAPATEDRGEFAKSSPERDRSSTGSG